jgi:prepilin-type N-terminal cleavage/methylation domain-containing protein/prepilin-type processing-associated H-X9-DG protein
MSRKIFRRFTLVELLVVVAILSILLGLLMPTLQRARLAAKKIVCTSNLKQLGIAFLSYTGDCKGHYPFWGGSTQCTVSNWSYDFRRFDYLGDIGILRCPSSLDAGLTHPNTNGSGDISNSAWPINAHAYIAYGYNNYNIGSGYYQTTPHDLHAWITARVSMVRKPGETILVADSFRMLQQNLGEHTLTKGPCPPWSPAIHDRHDGGANILWADYHVSFNRNACEYYQDGSNTYFDLQ